MKRKNNKTNIRYKNSKRKNTNTKKRNKNNVNSNKNEGKTSMRNKYRYDKLNKDSLSIISGFLTINNKSKVARTGKNYPAQQTNEYLKKIKSNCKKMNYLKSIKIENLDRYFDEDIHLIDEELLGFHRIKDVLSHNAELNDDYDYAELEKRLNFKVRNRKHEYDFDEISYMLLNAETDEALQTELLAREMEYLMRNKYVNLEGKTKYVIDIPNSSRKTINELRNKIYLIDCEDKEFERKYNEIMNTIIELMKNKNIEIYSYRKKSRDVVAGDLYNIGRYIRNYSKEKFGNFEKMGIDKNTFIETVLVKNI